MKLKDLVTQKDKFIFRHQSPFKLKTLRPLSLKELYVSREKDLGKNIVEYMSDRNKTEDNYREIFNRNKIQVDKNKSFLYATVVGFHKMESPESYPGYTYYFKLTPEQINKCIFEVVAVSGVLDGVKPGVGFNSLKDCIRYWEEIKSFVKPEKDPILGWVDPRIEVVIPFEVKPLAWVLQQEDR